MKNEISDGNESVQVEGNNSIGDVLSSAISSEQNTVDIRSQSINNITGLEIGGNIAVVDVQTQIEADLVVAIYDEHQLQMLASGEATAEVGANTVQVNLSGEIPQYFIASAYLLKKESHEPLCEAYTTELYTRSIQELKNSTVKDYDEEKVVQLDTGNEETNFAVYNEETVIVKEMDVNNQLVDHGDGSYTINNAESRLLNMKEGDTFSYQYSDATVLLIKIADMSIDGTSVTIYEDSDTELSDYFDYVKIEADSSTGECSVDNSNLEEGIIPVDSVENVGEFSAGEQRLGGNLNTNQEVSYKIEKEIKKVTITGNIKFNYGISVDYYFSGKHTYFSLQFDYSTGVSVEISGQLLKSEIPLGHISLQPAPCVNIGFTPCILLDASGKIVWSGTMKGKIGGAYDSNCGFYNNSAFPSSESEFKVEGTLFVGIKATPYVSIISEDLAKAYTEVSVGVQFSAKQQIYATSEDVLHDCKKCLAGDIRAKASVEMAVNLVKGKIDKRTQLVSGEIKITDFYWSLDYMEFKWESCPHICYPISVTLEDNHGNSIKEKITLSVTDQNSGKTVEIRMKELRSNSVEIINTDKIKIYLPSGDYIIKAVTGNREGQKEVSIRDRGTSTTVQLNMNNVNVDHNISWWIENNDTLYIEGLGNMPDYVRRSGSGKFKVRTSAPWNYENEKDDVEIKKVIIGDGITSIGNYAFASLNSLKEIIISKDVISIGEFSFFDCSSLENISIPEKVTGIGMRAFYLCVELKNIKIPNNVSVIRNGTFGVCSSFTEIEIPESVTEIEDTSFDWCESLRTIKISENVKKIGDFTFSRNNYQSIYFKGNKPEFGLQTFYRARDITVYYPNNDSTWNGIDSESFGGTNIKWIPYDPTIVFAELNEGIEVTTTDDLAADVVAGQENSDFSSESCTSESTENSYIDITTNSEKSIETDGFCIEESEEENFSDIGDEETNTVEVPVSYTQNDITDAGTSVMFSKLIPYSRHILVIVKNDQAENVFEYSNLLYIKQETSDSTGTISFQYLLRENFSNPVVRTYGATKDINTLEVMLSENTYVYDGSAKTPSVKLTDGNHILQNGVDYTVSYFENTNAGDATAEITGNGTYAGSRRIKFNIERAEPKLKFESAKVTQKFGSGLFVNSFSEEETDGEIKFSSSNIKVASVDENSGQIKFTGVGKTIITAETKGGINYKSGKTSFTLRVIRGDNTIIAKNAVKQRSRRTQRVYIKATVKDRAKLTYTSNKKAVKVSARGTVTIPPNFSGRVIITIKSARTSRYNSATKKVRITVKR